MYVNDWNYRFGETKVVFGRLGSGGGNAPDDAESEEDAMASRGPCPVVALAPAENNLAVSMAVYPPNGEDADPADIGAGSGQRRNRRIHTCGVPNIPLQRWTNVLLSCLDRTLDIYLDGKLVRTCMLPGVPKINASAPVAVKAVGTTKS